MDRVLSRTSHWHVNSLRAGSLFVSGIVQSLHSTCLSPCWMKACVITTLWFMEDYIQSVTSSIWDFLEHRVNMVRQIANHIYPRRWMLKSQPFMQKGHSASTEPECHEIIWYGIKSSNLETGCVILQTPILYNKWYEAIPEPKSSD